MMLTARGTITLNSYQFTSDPDSYERQWPKRASEHETVGGGRTIQDFGRFAKDMLLTLQSGQNQYIEKSLVDQLDTLAGTRGATYALVDWEGTEATVFILRFDPVHAKISTLYRYTMTLRVVTLTKLRGASYSGS